MHEIGLGIAIFSLLIWLGLLIVWGQFWRTDQRLEPQIPNPKPNAPELPDSPLASSPASWPAVCAVIPARNEADLLPITLRSLLQQDYPGLLTIILVDDHSTDGTGAIAQATAASLGQEHRLRVLLAEPLPAGWTGKLWAMEQGTQLAKTLSPDYILLTDADIQHDSANVRRLVTQSLQHQLDLASIMVRLRCESFWEKLLIPAFVFFFQKLYPFRFVNNPNHPIAAAAGGCILIRQTALDRIGGLSAIRQALIDDCALAHAVKLSGRSQPNASSSGGIWLGLSDRTLSLRPYPSLASIWNMVARTAFTQLHYSPLLLTGTLLGMTLVYLVSPLAIVMGGLLGDGAIAFTGLATWLLMSLAYWPIIRFYRCPPILAAMLPAIAFLYTLMTLDSALRHWQGRGGAWKGRVYSGS